jgi:hypothetical protein
MNGWQAFRHGLSHALRCHQVLLILFAVNLLSALALAVLPALGLATDFGHRPAIRQAADGVDAWLVVETLLAPLAGADAGPAPSGGPQPAALLGLATVALLPLLAWLPAAFLSGGVLVTYAGTARLSPGDGAPSTPMIPTTSPPGEAKPPRFRWRRFLWGCWHWFGAFLLLGAAQGITSMVLFLPFSVAVVIAIAAVGGWLAWVLVPLLVLAAVLWLALMECTRIIAVVEQTRNVSRAFGRAVRLVFRRLPAIAGLYGLALLLLGSLHALYRWGLMPHLPLDWWPLVLIVQQAFVLARLGARLARLAGGIAIVRQSVAQ